MPFYMFTARDTAASMKALIQHSSDREVPARQVAESLGGTLHHLFFAMGQDDVIAIAEMPDDVSVAALSMTIGASGGLFGGATTKLLTPAAALEVMQKAGAAQYAPPNG
ncbi:MAG: GYD domain-containing protein [Pseudomonadota bacterium]